MRFLIGFLFLGFLVGCDNLPTGKKSQYYDWECVKETTGVNLGLSMQGDLVMTPRTDCLIAKCFKFEKYEHKYIDKIKRLDMVDDKLCMIK